MLITPQSRNHDPLIDSKLLISMGVYDGVTSVNKFGTNETVGTTYEEVWRHGGSHIHTTAGILLEVASSNVNDTAAGTGARTVTIEGVGLNWEELSETVTLNGQTPVTTANVYRAINRAWVETAGGMAMMAPLGEIAIAKNTATWTVGVPDDDTDVLSTIGINVGQTQQALYVVPAGFTAFLTQVYCTSPGDKTVTFRFFDHDLGDSNVMRLFMEGDVGNGSEFHLTFDPYVKVTEKRMIMARAKIDVGTALVSAGFDMILVSNDLFQ